MHKAETMFPKMAEGTLKRRSMEMRRHVIGELNQIRDEYLSDQREGDAKVVQETIDMAMRIAEERKGHSKPKKGVRFHGSHP